MLIPDVNILIGAYRGEDPRHHELHKWLVDTIEAGTSIGLTPAVVGGYVRIVTNPAIYDDPTPIEIALAHIDALRVGDSVVDVRPGPRHWEIFAELCREANARGNLVADAAHAAVAIEHSATLVTLDRDFARFPGLRWELPGNVR